MQKRAAARRLTRTLEPRIIEAREEREMPKPTDEHDSTRKIPALVVSGFLGSGKTTLVRHLLECAQKEGVRIAVVSNEFGELGIDAALLGQTSDNYVELEGGCVCCKLGDELVDTLQTLRERSDPDRIVVETSGVALPYDTLIHFWRDPVRHWIGDDASVVVVNAEQVAEEHELAGTFEDQVSSADLLLVNKTDLIAPDAVAAVDRRLRELEPDAPIIHAQFGRVEPVVLFPPDPDGRRAARRENAAVRPHSHEQFETEQIDVEAGISSAECERRLAGIGALRVKGFVETSEGLRLVQGVGRRVTLSVPEDAPDPAVVGRIVVIRRAEVSASGT
jgi:cobalamin biosynthesis protein CobW